MTNAFSLEGKSVAVIGAGSGIGRAVAIGVAEQGAYVTCLDVKADTSAETAAMIKESGGEADSAACDIVDATSVNDAIVKAAARYNRLDGVVCTPAINV